MRSLARSISAVGLLAATSLAGCGAGGEDLETETRSSELQISQASSGLITDDQSYVRAAVVPINQSNFAVLYQFATDGMHHLVRYTIPAPGTQPAVIQNPVQFNLGVDPSVRNFTVRANTSPPLARNRVCNIGSGFGSYNFAVVQQLGKVSLDTHTFSPQCGGWLYSRRTIDDGIRPSVATKGTGSNGGRALIVYGTPGGQVLRGRILSWSVNLFTGAYLEALGEAFTIALQPVGGELFVNTDVVYSAASDKFIVGFTTNSDSSGACRVWNIVLNANTTIPTVSRAAKSFGNCSHLTGPTPTFAALSAAAGTDMYLWSRTDTFGTRGVFAHSTTDGLPISFVAPLQTDGPEGTVFSNPVAVSNNPNEPYAILYSKGDGVKPVETQIWSMSFPNRTFGRLENSFAPPGAPIAIGSSPTATIALSAVLDPPGNGPRTRTLRMDISDLR